MEMELGQGGAGDRVSISHLREEAQLSDSTVEAKALGTLLHGQAQAICPEPDCWNITARP